MNARPLDHVLPARLVCSFAIARARLEPRVHAIASNLARAWRRAQHWAAAIALVLAYTSVAGWLEARDARLEAQISQAALEAARSDNARLEARIAEASVVPARDVFYVLEGRSLEEITAKLQRLGVAIAGTHFDLTNGKDRRP